MGGALANESHPPTNPHTHTSTKTGAVTHAHTQQHEDAERMEGDRHSTQPRCANDRGCGCVHDINTQAYDDSRSRHSRDGDAETVCARIYLERENGVVVGWLWLWLWL